MALIPYNILPDQGDPPLQLAGRRIEEFYCGDARCDCVTAHVAVDGVPMTVDLGTLRLDLSRNQQPEALQAQARATMLKALTEEGVVNKLRAHYGLARRFGLHYHYQFVDWTRRDPGEPVAWEEVFRQEQARLWALPGVAGPAEAGQDAAAAEKLEVRVFLQDSYCVDKACDCRKVQWRVGVMVDDSRARILGTVACNLENGEPAVMESPSMDPNQLFLLTFNLIQQHADLLPLYRARYRQVRQMLIPLLHQQRRYHTEQKALLHRKEAGRNDPCPCGSGKKRKRCHG